MTEPLQLFVIAGVSVGVSICEDAWSPTGPIAAQAAGGAELVLNINASPFYAGRVSERERMLATRAADASCALVYVNQVGGQDELVFDGASLVFDADGSLVAPRRRSSSRGLLGRPRRRARVPETAARSRGWLHGEALPQGRDQPSTPTTDERSPARRSPRCPTATRRSTKRWSSAPATTSARTGSRTSSSASPAASTPRSSRASPPTRSGPSTCTACSMPRRYSSDGSSTDAEALARQPRHRAAHDRHRARPRVPARDARSVVR